MTTTCPSERCPEHPLAMVLHTWRAHRMEYHAAPPPGIEWAMDDTYHCAVCGRELPAQKGRGV